MSSRADHHPGSDRSGLAFVLCLAAVAMALPLSTASRAAANVDEPTVLEAQTGRAGSPAAGHPTAGSQPNASGQPGPNPTLKPANGYLLRCWQYGRLVIEESGVRVDLERYQSRLRGIDRQGNSLLVADTGNSTCLLRADRSAKVSGVAPIR